MSLPATCGCHHSMHWTGLCTPGMQQNCFHTGVEQEQALFYTSPEHGIDMLQLKDYVKQSGSCEECTVMRNGRHLSQRGSRFDLDVIGLSEPSSSEPVRLRCLVFPFDNLLRQNSHMVHCRRQDAQDRMLDSTGAILLVANLAINTKECSLVSPSHPYFTALYRLPPSLISSPSCIRLLLHQLKDRLPPGTQAHEQRPSLGASRP